MLLGVWLVGEHRDTPYEGSSETPNPLREWTSIRVLLFTGDVRLTKHFGAQVSATFPDVTRAAILARPTGDVEYRERFRGLGDTSVVGWYQVPNSRGWNLTLNAGVSLPTGKTEQPRFAAELDDDSLVPITRLQRGSGTVDPLVGFSANTVINSIFPPGTRVFATAAARLPLRENKFGLRTGASFEVGVGASREVRWHSLVVLGRLSWLHRELDVFDGVPVLVGGGEWLAFSPGVAIGIGKSTLQAEIRFPLHRSLANRQLDSSWLAQAGFVRAF